MPDDSSRSDDGGCDGFCAFCQSEIRQDHRRVACADCDARYHAECWDLNGGCAVYGCAQAPPVEKRNELEIPPAYWGQEAKPCPVCGKEILAAALRCRYCGATFSSSRPESGVEFEQRRVAAMRGPELRRKSIWLFVLCTVSCTAPLAAFVGCWWYRRHRKAVSALPGLYRTLCLLGLSLGLGQSAVLVIMGLLHARLRH